MRLHADPSAQDRPKKRRLGRFPGQGQDHAHEAHHKGNPKDADCNDHALHHKVSNWVKKRNEEKPPVVKHSAEKAKHDCASHEEFKADYDWNALNGQQVKKLLDPHHHKENWRSFVGHVDNCHSC
jgi:hypothetical protein